MEQSALPGNKKYFLLLFLLISFGSFLFLQVVMDDAYIPFRYGYNLVHHGVWNYHPNGQNKVEAYTTFLYAALSVIPALLHIHPYIVYKGIGVVLFFSVLLLLYRSTQQKRVALFAILIFSANWETYVHTYSGLETMLWCWLFLQVIFILNSELHSRKQIYLWVLCLLLPLTRPEGILIWAFAFCYLRFIKKIKINYTALFICAIMGILYFAWRYQYFGMLLPLPFYQKSVKNNTGIVNLIINTFSSIHYITTVVFFAVILRKHAFFKWLTLFSLAVFFVVYGTSLLTMNFAERFPYQLFFPVLLAGIIFHTYLPEIEKIKVKYGMVFLVIFIFAKGFYSTHAKDFTSMGDNMFSSYYYSRTHLNLALHFRKLHHPDMKVFCNEAGIFPYYSNVDYYDPEGLTNKALCKKTITKEYIEQINPDVFLYLIATPQEEAAKWVNGLGPYHPLNYYRYLLNSDQYDKIGYVTCIEHNVYIGIAVNKQSRYYGEICIAGKDAIAEAKENSFNPRKFLKFKYYRSFPTL